MADQNTPKVKYVSDEKWHVDKSVSLGHIVATAVFVISGVMFFNTQGSRIAANTQSIAHLQSQRTEDQVRLEKRLDSIDAKLDSLLLNYKQP